MAKYLVNIFIILAFGTNTKSQIDGKYYALNRDICKEGKYWECYSEYVESTYENDFLVHHIPSNPSSECGRVFKLNGKNLILGNMNSFDFSDTLTIESQTENEIIFTTPNSYTNWLSRIRKIPMADNEIELLLTKTIGKKQTKGFYNYNQILLDENIYSKEEILKELQNPNFREIAKYDVIRLNFPKKWERKVNRELKKELRKIKKEVKKIKPASNRVDGRGQ